jgi:group II intron reverse transcriptase/maturase
MRDAETVLAVIRERGRRGLPLDGVYRQLFNPSLYLRAYGRIARNDGAMTPGVTDETVDGMSMRKIEAIIDAVRHERYRWTPVRRTYIEKKNSTKKRPLGIPTWSDKLLQEVLRSILEAYYEPQFSAHSHGFRPERGCHTALQAIHRTWNGTTWFIEGDISKCFDSLDHEILMATLGEKILDNRLLRLIKGLLNAGYMEDWKFNVTLSGTPQGGIVSPILSNIYLDRLDRFVGKLIQETNRGAKRAINPEYKVVASRMARRIKTDRHAEAEEMRKQLQGLPYGKQDDPDFRRLRYVRYADDFLLGFIGPRQEAEKIKEKLGQFLRDDLKLELSAAKTLITHAQTERARFLGYEVETYHSDMKHTEGRRSVNGVVALKVPANVVREKCQHYMLNGKPTHLTRRTIDSDFTNVARYQQEYRGIVEYYRLADNLTSFGRLKWVMQESLAKTLASKLKISVAQFYARYHTTIQTEQGPRSVFRVVIEREGKKPLTAQWGGISLKWKKNAVLNDQPAQINGGRTELVERLLADTCELCGSQDDIDVHHIRKLSDLAKKGRSEKPDWVKQMAARHRKTLVVCDGCHHRIHAGVQASAHNTGEPGDAKVSSPVRGGVDAKVVA